MHKLIQLTSNFKFLPAAVGNVVPKNDACLVKPRDDEGLKTGWQTA